MTTVCCTHAWSEMALVHTHDRFDQWALLILGDDPDKQREAVHQLCSVLEENTSPPVDSVLRSGIVERLIDFLKSQEETDLQLHVTSILANLATCTPEQVQVVIDANAIPPLLNLARTSPVLEVRESCFFALGNFLSRAKLAVQARVLEGGIVMSLVEGLEMALGNTSISAHAREAMLCTGAQVARSLLNGKKDTTPLPWGQIRPLIPILCKCVLAVKDNSEALQPALSTLFAAASRNVTFTVKTVVNSGLVPRIVKLLLHPQETIQLHALHVLADVASGTDKQSQTVFDAGVLPALKKLLGTMDRDKMTAKVVEDACFLASNLTAGTTNQIQQVLDAGMIPVLLCVLALSEHAKAQREACIAAVNISHAKSAQPQQIQYVIDCGVIPVLIQVIGSCKDKELASEAENALETFRTWNVRMNGQPESGQMPGLVGGVEVQRSDTNFGEAGASSQGPSPLARLLYSPDELLQISSTCVTPTPPNSVELRPTKVKVPHALVLEEAHDLAQARLQVACIDAEAAQETLRVARAKADMAQVAAQKAQSVAEMALAAVCKAQTEADMAEVALLTARAEADMARAKVSAMHAQKRLEQVQGARQKRTAVVESPMENTHNKRARWDS
ncbi:hypothetical protein AMAG_09916 [Allomyces macrogynus ATCC 38327]|uniref:Uncharacterized protein n=1 Tax=Allomyces macrogynus (strain ATCC 38327) TaxID=578462 RepID=A0A0L0SPZ3_ALLM3|nr:hypothetical protein AMAG_09916 [Allomyces macrogynus ATCC 38327]|eukprot:KNE64557.1 hypothetical protein AMAG_09916 [Allomyces macrogynus ATCC 38327]